MKSTLFTTISSQLSFLSGFISAFDLFGSNFQVSCPTLLDDTDVMASMTDVKCVADDFNYAIDSFTEQYLDGKNRH